ncbi:MAG: PQQ-dependent sugar dehydrogenase [Sphingomonadales bacterium]
MTIARVRLLLAAGLLLCTAAAAAAKDHVVETVLDGLDRPWSLSFLPDGAMLITGHQGALWIVRDGKLSAPVSGVPAVKFAGQGGLFEALPHPDFAANRLVYLSYAHAGPEGNALRVARARLEGGALTGLQVLFESKPARSTAVHYGGRMAWLPDGTLLVTGGDGFDYREQAQKLDSDFGKIVRLNDDGSVPADNPFVGRAGSKPEIWSYGHRNAQGIVHDPATGRVYAHEHGPRGGDEINLIEKGANYGWPLATRGMDYSGAYITPFTSYKGTTDAIHGWTPSIAPCGFAIYHGAAFPQWDGDLFVGALARTSLRRVDMEQGKVVGEEIMLADLGARIRDVRVGPDGLIYVLTDGEGGKLLRLKPGA